MLCILSVIRIYMVLFFYIASGTLFLYCIMNSDDLTEMMEEEDEEYIVQIVVLLLTEELDRLSSKQPCRTSQLRGHDYVLELINGHEDRCYDQFRMDPNVFVLFCEELKSKGNLNSSRYVTVQEQVAIFLLIISHNERIRIVVERFQHSGHTIHFYFHRVLKAVCRLGVHIIRPPDFNIVPPQIRHNPKYYPFFKVRYILLFVMHMIYSY